MIHLTTFASPVGELTLGARNARVCLLHFGADGPKVRGFLQHWFPGEAIEPHGDPAGAVRRLSEYFGGQIDAIDGIPVEMGGTPFQQRVWNALRRVPSGTTASYAGIARAIGAPTSTRAVGAANGANPIAIIVPCHRVIGADGSLTGYGGGLERKRWLLQHEGWTGVGRLTK